MVNKLVIALIFLALWTNLTAQNSSCPLAESQLLRIQKSTDVELNKYLSTSGWSIDRSIENPMYDYFGSFLDYQLQRFKNAKALGSDGLLLVYQKAGIPNLVIYQTTAACFTNMQRKIVQTVKNLDYTKNVLAEQDGVVMEFREYPKESGQKRYSVLIYKDESLKSQMLKDQTRAARYRQNKDAGDLRYRELKFGEALRCYEAAKMDIQLWDNDALDEIEFSLKNTRNSLLKESYGQLLKKGDSVSRLEKYQEAVVFYKDAAAIDSTDQSLLLKIRRSVDFLNIKDFSAREQSYAYLNPNGYKAFRAINVKALEELLLHGGNSGRLNYTSLIKFDAQGHNLSNVKINYLSNRNLSSYLSGMSFSGISQPRILNVPVPVREELNFNLTWKTNKILAAVKHPGIDFENDDFSTSRYNDKIKQFIHAQSFRNGRYGFEVVEKKLNGNYYEDLRMASFVAIDGPANCFYSMVFPGWGSKKISDGKRGNGRMTLFIVSAALSLGSKIFSGFMFRKYQDDPAHSEKYYANANLSNKIFLVTGGISAGIYLSDIVHVFTRGVKNDNKNRPLKRILRKSPVSIIHSPLKP